MNPNAGLTTGDTEDSVWTQLTKEWGGETLGTVVEIAHKLDVALHFGRQGTDA